MADMCTWSGDWAVKTQIPELNKMFVLGINEIHQGAFSECSPTSFFPFLPFPHPNETSLVNHSTCPNQPTLTQDAQHVTEYTEALGKLFFST